MLGQQKDRAEPQRGRTAVLCGKHTFIYDVGKKRKF